MVLTVSQWFKGFLLVLNGLNGSYCFLMVQRVFTGPLLVQNVSTGFVMVQSVYACSSMVQRIFTGP